ncbi:MAG: glutathione peroxidase [Bacteroidia bacterium]|nr:glutathione peroxidase [Bacteroidia bacterium]MDW8335227.1 glutathione peroxidase [Bacteroidia bacterium]
MSIYDFTLNDIDGNPVSLSQFKGKTMVLVNVASRCGLTPQYAELEEFYRQNKDRVVVLGFPANNFAGQEPGSNEEIKAFCKTNYEVSFPMFSKISVKGEDRHPLYDYLVRTTETEVAWNFQKYVVSPDGMKIVALAPTVSINSDEARAAIGAA